MKEKRDVSSYAKAFKSTACVCVRARCMCFMGEAAYLIITTNSGGCWNHWHADIFYTLEGLPPKSDTSAVLSAKLNGKSRLQHPRMGLLHTQK